MKKIRILIQAAAFVLAGAVCALAANTTFFTSIGDIIFPLVAPTSTGVGGTIGDVVRGGMAPVNGSGSYTKTAATTGFRLTFGNYQTDMLLEPSGTLAAGYITMAPNPVDGANECVFSTHIITALSISANAGQSINNAITTLGALGSACYRYSLSNLTWDQSR